MCVYTYIYIYIYLCIHIYIYIYISYIVAGHPPYFPCWQGNPPSERRAAPGRVGGKEGGRKDNVFGVPQECGTLPYLETLELGWNELSEACAAGLKSLLTEWTACGASGRAEGAAPRLRKLGLGGNRLGSEGATALAAAALRHPSRDLELDLSMNHVGAAAVHAIAEWAEASLAKSTSAASGARRD